MLSDYLQPPPPANIDFVPFSFPSNTGPKVPVFNTDDQGNLVVGAPLVTSSFVAPTGASTVNFTSGVLIGGTQGFPPSSGDVAMEIPLHGTLGLAQAQSVLVTDPNSNPVFYTTSNPTWTGPAARVFGTLQAGKVVIGGGTGPAAGLLVASTQGPGFYASADAASKSAGGYNARVFGDFRVDGYIYGPEGVYSQAGPTGPAGVQGSAGAQGPVGSQGPIGSQGPVGPQGPVGSQGVAGIQGLDGIQGSIGPQGPVGSQGVAGVSYTGPTGATPSLSGYLTTTAAAATYLTTASAASTYLTSATATSTYAPKASPAFSGTITYGGTDLDTLYRPWVIATIDGSTGSVTSTSGKAASVSCSRTAAGTYTVSFSTTPSGAPSAVLVTLRNATGYGQYSGATSTSVNVALRNTSAALFDAAFAIVIFL